MFVFGTDVLGEGVDVVLNNLQGRAGVDAVALSTTYHDARDVFPHNPCHHVYRHVGDIAWFRPDARSYASGLVPRPAGETDVLAQVCEAAAGRGMDVHAWTIFLHNSVLATEHPDCATRNAYGDPYLTDLCPANPRVHDYAVELATDIARYPVARLVAESLHYRPLEHGNHHERYLIDLPASSRTLLSLCFCEHCRRTAEGVGVDTERLVAAVQAALSVVWDDALPDPADPGRGHLATEEESTLLHDYVACRQRVVTALVADVRRALASSGVPLTFIDHAGAMSHVMVGTSGDDPVAASSRRLGIDAAAAASACDELAVLGYVDTAPRLQALLDEYRRTVGPGTRLAVALRPLLPDCAGESELVERVAAVRDAGVDRVDFYHYAMMPLPRLDWVARALHGDGS